MTNSILSQSPDIFKAVKEIPFPEIFKQFGGPVTRRKALCPFHAEKSPSFHIYDDGFKCFGCGEAGDGVAFVAKLHGTQPLEAARMITKRSGGGHISRARVTATRVQDTARSAWAYDTATRMRILIDGVHTLFAQYGTDIEGGLLAIVHRMETFEYWRDTLISGDAQERAALFNNPSLRRWFPW